MYERGRDFNSGEDRADALERELDEFWRYIDEQNKIRESLINKAEWHSDLYAGFGVCWLIFAVHSYWYAHWIVAATMFLLSTISLVLAIVNSPSASEYGLDGGRE